MNTTPPFDTTPLSSAVRPGVRLLDSPRLTVAVAVSLGVHVIALLGWERQPAAAIQAPVNTPAVTLNLQTDARPLQKDTKPTTPITNEPIQPAEPMRDTPREWLTTSSDNALFAVADFEPEPKPEPERPDPVHTANKTNGPTQASAPSQADPAGHMDQTASFHSPFQFNLDA